MTDFDVNFILRVTDQTAGAVGRLSGQFAQARKAATGEGPGGRQQKNGFFGFHGSEMYQGAAAIQHLTGMTKRAVGAPLELAMEFEHAEKRINALSGGALAAEGKLKILSKRARELGASTEFTASETMDAFGTMTKAGFKYQEQLDSIQTILDLSTAGEITLEKSTDLTASALGGFGLEATAENVERVGNVINRTSKSAQISIGQVGDSLKYAAPNASKLGIEIESVAEATAILGAAGLKGGMAGTSMRSFFNRLAMFANEDLSTPAQNKAASMLGLDREKLKEALDTGDLQTVSKFMGDTVNNSGLERSDQVALLQKMFRERGALGAQILMASATAEDGSRQSWGKIAADVNDSNITLAKSAEEMRSSAKAGLKEYNSAMEELGITVGEELMPALVPLLKTATDIARGTAEWAKKHPTLVKWLGLTAVGLVGIGTVAAPVLMSLASLNTLMGLSAGTSALMAGRVAMAGRAMAAFAVSTKGAVLASFAVGYAIGTILDDWLGLSDKISQVNTEMSIYNKLTAQQLSLQVGLRREREGSAKYGSLTEEEKTQLKKSETRKGQLAKELQQLDNKAFYEFNNQDREFLNMFGGNYRTRDDITRDIQTEEARIAKINKDGRKREREQQLSKSAGSVGGVPGGNLFGPEIAAQISQVLGQGMKGTINVNTTTGAVDYVDEGDIPLNVNSGLNLEGI